MKYTIVIDNFCSKQGLLAEWGFSGWLDTGDKKILFDTGGICHILRHNLNFLKLNPAELDALVLSHGHFDHISGLLDIIRVNPNAAVYSSPAVATEKRGDADAKRLSGGFPVESLSNFRPVKEVEEIAEGVYAITVAESKRDNRYVCCKNLWEVDSSGQIVADRFEDDVSMVVRGNNGWSLLLGCSHAGLPNIMRFAGEQFGIKEFDTVVGGSHLCAVAPADYGFWIEQLQKFKVRRWRLNHCTGFKAAAKMAEAFEDVDWAGCGTVLEL